MPNLAFRQKSKKHYVERWGGPIQSVVVHDLA